MTNEKDSSSKADNFIHEIVEKDLSEGKHGGKVVTRFPPEPNGYLHIGHAKAICLDFETAQKYGGHCNLRFDDTNPIKEEAEYVDSIEKDVNWLGFDWAGKARYASDYFEEMYLCAVKLIKQGQAYVCDLSVEEFREYRGVPTRPGKESPGRERSKEENLDIFERMKKGEFEDGAYTLRAKIDMESPNLHLRDPAIYRIKHAHHHRTEENWCIYPMYDFAHCLEDYIEGITHSFCTLEFEVHRPLYDWILDALKVDHHPQQIEFARLNMSYTVMSKRKLMELVEAGLVEGWDDPRMPTLCGLRRRGCPAEAIREFCHRIGITKYESLSDVALFEHCLRDVLNETAPRVLGVLDPVKLIIDNYPEGEEEEFDARNHPGYESAGTRKVPFSRELYIERKDFMEDPPKKFYRLAPGREVRLKYACLVVCKSVVKDADGQIKEIHCEFDPQSRGGSAPDGRKVRGTIHWVSAKHALKVDLRLYDRLFEVKNPLAEEGDFKDYLNPDSLKTIQSFVEPSLSDADPGSVYQFERMGYFCRDSKNLDSNKLIFNRTISMRDTWRRREKNRQQGQGKK